MDFTNADFSRRKFMKYSAGAVAMSGLMGMISWSSEEKQTRIPVGLQLYSVRKESEKDFPKTIKAVAKIGYEGVEFAGYFNHDAKELRKILDDTGLKCCGTHTQLADLAPEKFAATMELNQILGNKYIIVPWLGEEMRNTEQAWLNTVKLFNELAEKVKEHGMRLGYHNHTFEFESIGDKMPWDIFAENTNADIILQLDTGNLMQAGVEPVSFLKKYPGRTLTIHLKEYSATNDKAITGEGDMPWKEVLEVCRTTGGTEWFILEEEKDVYPPLECVELCYKNFQKLI